LAFASVRATTLAAASGAMANHVDAYCVLGHAVAQETIKFDDREEQVTG
jgi:hypothetical protein